MGQDSKKLHLTGLREEIDDDISANEAFRVLALINEVVPEELRDRNLSNLGYLYHQLCDLLETYFKDVPERDQEIFAMRNGLGEFDRVFTLEETAEKMKVTRERVRQIEQKTLARLRHPHFRNYWTFLDKE